MGINRLPRRFDQGGTAIHEFLNASEKVATAPPPPPTPTPVPPSGAPAIVLGGSEDTRLLLRGLLRLHRHRVLLEAPTREAVDRLPPSAEVKILVLDAGTDKADVWANELSSLLRVRSDLRALVILPSSDPGLETRARQAGARAVLVRPFAIRDFVEAVDSIGAPPSST
ncbi:MAG TPA: hypothetical protein VEG66_05600 [Thermoplasmata archaeon]|nr:hypothetical protein [Thermoplasmata archaeon]